MFYQFRQNNSGGWFVRKPNLDVVVIIEATSAEDANQRAQNFGIYFDGVREGYDCNCCGDRWCPATEDDASHVPAHYGEPIKCHATAKAKDEIVVHYLTGERKYAART